MFTLILTVLFASAYGEFCNPNRFSSMMLHAQTGVSYKFAVDYDKNISYLGDVERTDFRFANTTSGKWYIFSPGSSCQVADRLPPLMRRCLPSDAQKIATNNIGGPSETLRLHTYRITNADGDEEVETYSRAGRNQVLFSRRWNEMNFVYYNARTDEDVEQYLNPDVSECS